MAISEFLRYSLSGHHSELVILFKRSFKVYVCVSVCVCVGMHTCVQMSWDATRGRRIPWSYWSYRNVNRLAWVLGVQSGPLDRGTLSSHWTASLPKLIILCPRFSIATSTPFSHFSVHGSMEIKNCKSFKFLCWGIFVLLCELRITYLV